MPVLVVLRKIQRKAIPRIAQPLDLSSVSRIRHSVLWGLGQRLNKQKTICSANAEWMVFRICIYRCIACATYEKIDSVNIDRDFSKLSDNFAIFYCKNLFEKI